MAEGEVGSEELRRQLAKQEPKGFIIAKQEQQFKRYLCIDDRTVTYPDGRDIAYDVVVTRSNQFVTVVPFHRATQTFTLIREYWQGPHCLGTGVATGGYDLDKHASARHAAECELSEECQLRGGTWVRLIPEGHPGVMESKWAATRFVPFVVIDPVKDEAPKKRDAEEWITVESVGVDEAEELAFGGLMSLPSALSLLMSLRYLRKMSIIPMQS